MFKRLFGTGMAVAVAMTIGFASQTASAKIWKITNVQSGAQGGFGFSLIHSASRSNHMSGTRLATITGSGSLGHYNDVTGELNATFDLSGTGIGAMSTMTITTFATDRPLFNNPNGTLSAASRFFVDFDINFTGAATALQLASLVDATVGFMDGYVCCGNNGDDPNSFHVKPNNTAVMSLWGADDFNLLTQEYGDPRFGMDLRLTMVPEPMSMALFGFGLAGLRLVRRRTRR